MDAFDNLLRETIFLCAFLALPILLSATAVGVIVAVVQAATQVQEQTLTLLPKILAVSFVLVVFGHFGFEALGGLFKSAAHSMPEIVSAQPAP